MPKLKTNKSIAKRVKLTKDGRMLVRPAGQNHFNAKKTGKHTRRLRKYIVLSPRLAKSLRKYLPYSN
ncbi:50S ribosomal protein L35 [Patescibacteria group bacterium]|jgi:ribosomal protein L35|nr:50S ribosomal protein L35 [Patescibacteria group bacterium]